MVIEQLFTGAMANISENSLAHFFQLMFMAANLAIRCIFKGNNPNEVE